MLNAVCMNVSVGISYGRKPEFSPCAALGVCDIVHHNFASVNFTVARANSLKSLSRKSYVKCRLYECFCRNVKMLNAVCMNVSVGISCRCEA
jgi:hypothetical protein